MKYILNKKRKIGLICMLATFFVAMVDYSIYADEKIDDFMGQEWGMNLEDPFATFMGELYSDSGRIFDSIRIIIDTSNNIFYCPTDIKNYGKAEIDYCNFIFKESKFYAVSIGVNSRISCDLLFEEIIFKYGLPNSHYDDNTYYWEDSCGSILFTSDTINYSCRAIFSSIESTWDIRLEFGKKINRARKEELKD